MVERRYMQADPTKRIVAWSFSTVDLELADDTVGEVWLTSRAEPEDVWGPPVPKGRTTYGTYRARVEADGFVYDESAVESESLRRSDERVRIAVAKAEKAYTGGNVEIDKERSVESVDGGYWVPARIFIDAQDVEDTLDGLWS